jgi:DNA-binding NarL/FixJ family response regulator
VKGPASSLRPIRVLIVDDHPVVRQGLNMLLSRNLPVEVVGESGDADEALSMTRNLQPDLVLLDVSLQGMNGLELAKHLHAEWPKLPILMISRHDEALYARRAIEAGALGYITKSEPEHVFVDAVRSVLLGKIYRSARLQEPVPSAASGADPLEQLSDRELEVFELIGRGHGRREIAEALHLSVKTVETYRERIKGKLGLPSSNKLAQMAVQWVETSA